MFLVVCSEPGHKKSKILGYILALPPKFIAPKSSNLFLGATLHVDYESAIKTICFSDTTKLLVFEARPETNRSNMTVLSKSFGNFVKASGTVPLMYVRNYRTQLTLMLARWTPQRQWDGTLTPSMPGVIFQTCQRCPSTLAYDRYYH